MPHVPGPYVARGRSIYAVTEFPEIDPNDPGVEVAFLVNDEGTRRLFTASPDMLDALRQWAAAERDGDAEELQNARTSRDLAIARAIA